MKSKVALIQDSPIFFDKAKTLDKVGALVIQHAQLGCNLIVFPESFIPGYPRGFNFGTVIGSRKPEGRELYAEYYNNSIDVDSEDITRLEKLAKQQSTYLVLGVTERQKNNGSLYCSMLYISPTSGLIGIHRKIKPTGQERVIWAEAEGSSLVTFDTPLGIMGGLICWENYMPMARMAMYSKGVQIYIAPTADSRQDWTRTMQHIALEGRCYVLACNQYITKTMYPEKYQYLLSDEPENMCEGGSVIVNPMGEIIEGPLFEQAGALIAELDLELVTKNKLDFDVNGHYARNDIFNFSVNKMPETFKDQ